MGLKDAMDQYDDVEAALEANRKKIKEPADGKDIVQVTDKIELVIT